MNVKLHRTLIIGLLLAALFVLAGCGTLDVAVEPTSISTVPATAAPTDEPATAVPTSAPQETPLPTPSEEPEPTETATPAAEPTAANLPFEPATFSSAPLGFEFEYPADWTISDQGQIGPRGSATQFLDGDEVAMQMTIYLWDPKYDLDAYVDNRKTAWLASSMTLLGLEEWLIQDSRPAVGFTMQGVEGDVAYFFLTTIADRYLELSGPDPELISAIAHTFRLTEPETASEAHASLGCLTAAEGSSEWVACNVMDGLISRNTAALPSFMSDEFIIGYWVSEGVTLAPEEAAAQIQSLLPADPAAQPLTFTTDQSQFPPLQGMAVEGMFGPDVAVSHVIYSEGWGEDGQGAALLFIAQEADGSFYWHGMVYSFEHFDQ